MHSKAADELRDVDVHIVNIYAQFNMEDDVMIQWWKPQTWRMPTNI